MEVLKVRNLSVPYSSIDPSQRTMNVINNVSFDLKRGEILGIVGPTGCGKTVLLKAVAGLIQPFTGEVWRDDTDISQWKPGKREISMVFQNFCLYPHLTAKKNILFNIFRKKEFDVSPEAKLAEIVRFLGIAEEKVLDRYPRFISGGEKQRVALGKAIAVLPELLILDEPLSNIEINLRMQIRIGLKKMIKDRDIAALYVSHNQMEIAEIADKVAVMYQGRIEQIDTYQNLFDNPKRYFVSLFIGEESTNTIRKGKMAELTGGKINESLTVRPDQCSLTPVENSICISGPIVSIENFLSERKRVVYIEQPEQSFEQSSLLANLFGIQLGLDEELEKGQNIDIYVPLDKAKYFDESGDRIYNLW